MTDPNVHRPEWDHELGDPPFRSRSMRLGPRTGASEIGVSLYEIDPEAVVQAMQAATEHEPPRD